MYREMSIEENLLDAGCSKEETDRIIASYRNDGRRTAEKLIADCRKRQLDKLHECQRCIDRLDFLSYQMENGRIY